MSTAYQILNQQTTETDIEAQNRFYKKRNIENMPQYDSNFSIFQKSMNSRLKGMGIISTLFVIVSIIYYEQVISQALLLRPSFVELRKLKDVILVSSSEA